MNVNGVLHSLSDCTVRRGFSRTYKIIDVEENDPEAQTNRPRIPVLDLPAERRDI